MSSPGQDTGGTASRTLRDTLLTPLVRLWGLPDDPNLLRAQHRAFSGQVPLMYVILMTNTWALAITHVSHAPAWLTIGVPCLMTAITGLRIVMWWRRRGGHTTPERARAELGRTLKLGVVISLGFALWSLSLYSYGTAYTRAHVAFYMAITVISCIFCLMHLRPAAMTVAVIVNGLFVGFFISSGEPTFVASAVNVVLVSLAMLIILNINYNHFTHMVQAQAEAVALGNENFRLANLDSLTDLPNRRAFFARLAEAYEGGARERLLAVGILDLDGFKPVNDAYGHGVGDRLLQEVSRRLEAACAPHGIFLARLGGDEFAFLLTSQASEDQCLAWGQEVCEVLSRHFSLAGTVVQISGSLGIATQHGQPQSPQDLMYRADYALYQAKRGQRGSVVVFSEAHNDEIRRHAVIEQALRSADLESELKVVFQPIVDIRTEQAIGFEALARWVSPALGSVSPGEFIPVAERGGFVSRLTTTLLKKALDTATDWPAPMRLSFNLSAQDLSSPENLLRITAVIGQSAFDPRRLDLEITETAFAFDPAQVKRSVLQLRDLGCGISIDDFGTGYSSLSRLHSLPLTKLKIDRSFIARIEHDAASHNIVRSLIALSRDMKLDCVIEGVETAGELEVLRNLGGVLIQGYFYSPPVEASALAGCLSRFDRTRAATMGEAGLKAS
ncbi:EAL domain-containing protein [Phreatobacter sp.]|uniref:putative bifunctional diguanylate cyclase/phosphodiesterase n=1 Tax=Phreatobacter sp. TaxID=1966341 RepID=UPI0022C1BB77|nr:EAL domain-containing protein [Phreatobacter sp.]MCZ8313537.1 EAL domain-containing protein [Phreatobacter sp.]